MNAAFPTTPATTPNLLSIVKTIVVGLIAPQGLINDEDAQLVCQFTAR